MVMMTSVLQFVSPDCLSASLINFRLSVQAARLRRKHSRRQVGLATRCTDEEHADICGVARGILCADTQLHLPQHVACLAQPVRVPETMRGCENLQERSPAPAITTGPKRVQRNEVQNAYAARSK